jgi:hypothetical protein
MPIPIKLQRCWTAASADNCVVLRFETERSCYSFLVPFEQTDRLVNELCGSLGFYLITADYQLLLEPNDGGPSEPVRHQHLAQCEAPKMHEIDPARWSVPLQFGEIGRYTNEPNCLCIELNGVCFRTSRLLAKHLTAQLASCLGHSLLDSEGDHSIVRDAEGRLVLATRGGRMPQ